MSIVRTTTLRCDDTACKRFLVLGRNPADELRGIATAAAAGWVTSRRPGHGKDWCPRHRQPSRRTPQNAGGGTA